MTRRPRVYDQHCLRGEDRGRPEGKTGGLARRRGAFLCACGPPSRIGPRRPAAPAPWVPGLPFLLFKVIKYNRDGGPPDPASIAKKAPPSDRSQGRRGARKTPKRREKRPDTASKTVPGLFCRLIRLFCGLFFLRTSSRRPADQFPGRLNRKGRDRNDLAVFLLELHIALVFMMGADGDAVAADMPGFPIGVTGAADLLDPAAMVFQNRLPDRADRLAASYIL